MGFLGEIFLFDWETKNENENWIRTNFVRLEVSMIGGMDLVEFSHKMLIFHGFTLLWIVLDRRKDLDLH